MTQQEILTQLEVIFKDVLDLDELTLTPQTTAADVEEWDSLSHVQLVVAVEKHFGVKFTASEILSWKCVGDMVASINR